MINFALVIIGIALLPIQVSAISQVYYSTVTIERISSAPLQHKLAGAAPKENKVLIENIEKTFPFSEKGLEDLKMVGEESFHGLFPTIFSFAPEQQRVYILRYDLIYEYDIKTDKIRKLALPFENYDLEGDVIRKSPDGTKVASCGRRGIRVFDLIDNKEIVSIPARNVDGLLGGVDEFTVPPEKDPETLFQWTSNTTLVYPIYAQEGESVPPYHFKESKIIRLP
jgi:hypothetical protein